ncbi:MAG TPA: twin-arginine translocase subunit TatC [Patescibacteria group bacterium]|nr:twin-arginine translocase subunit TatC [Patescibacteria group bacterium]
MKKNDPQESAGDEGKTFSEHIQELRLRLLLYVLALVAGSIAGFLIEEKILRILVGPLGGPLYYSSPAGGFSFSISLSLFFGFVVSFPVLVYQVLLFLKPSLPKRNGKFLLLIFLSSIFLALTGILFAYYISLPASLRFLGMFNKEEVRALISTTDYLTFVTRYLAGFAIIFQMPVVIVVVNKFKRLTVRSLLAFERWIILISLVFAAVLTPTPDVLNQLVMAIPIIVLYQISLAAVALTSKKA